MKKWLTKKGRMRSSVILILICSILPWTTAWAQSDEKKEMTTTAPVPVTGNCIPMPDISSVKGFFSDLDGHWAEDSVYKMAAMGVIDGSSEGVFSPSAPVTRAEFTTILVKALIRTGNAQLDSAISFADTKKHWAQAYISTAVKKGVISGYDESTFHPNQTLTREQMAVMLENAMKFSMNADKFAAADESELSDWAENSVKALCDNQVLSLDESGAFHPQKTVTRAEAAEAVYKALVRKGYVTK